MPRLCNTTQQTNPMRLYVYNSYTVLSSCPRVSNSQNYFFESFCEYNCQQSSQFYTSRSLGVWDTATETSDPFKNSQDDLVQQLIGSLDDKTRMVKLKQAYGHLITVRDQGVFYLLARTKVSRRNDLSINHSSL
ncbi:hypothetical protein UPYG_G00352930 [Umbra pygmaea]|uniref:Uncharacterized protein n=1 Tax=Umbra pygmaea TaxID=75934 RepID=A0ABD0VVG0_UMBPY